MITAKTAASPGDGYWTIQVVDRAGSELGRRYVCRAHDAAAARSIANRLAGSAGGVAGFDYHRIDNPHGRYARALGLGESESIGDADTWAVLTAARCST